MPKKPAIWLVFDKLPKRNGGGLVITYARFVEEFEDNYNIRILEIFDNGKSDIPQFNDLPIISLSDISIDTRFYMAFSHLKQGHFKAFLWALFSALHFFTFIPVARCKTKALLADSIIIATSPAAAIFLNETLKYTLEIHTKYEYFWGDSPLGRAQVALIPQPALTLFRNKTDAAKARPSLCPSYIYNSFEGPTGAITPYTTRKPHSALFVGRLHPHKNPLKLLDYADSIRQKLPDFHLDIYGEGSLEEALRNEIAQRGLEDVVSLKGFTRDLSVYQNYRLFLLTSELEGFGLVLIEAMSYGTPVVTTEWDAAVHEIVKQGETGFIAPDKSQFIESSLLILQNEELAASMSKKAHDDFQMRFSASRNRQCWIEKLTKLYGADKLALCEKAAPTKR